MFKSILALSLLIPAFANAADLVGATDRDLHITIQELRGVKPQTKEMLFVKVTVERNGKDFEVFCDRGGSVKFQGSVNALTCVTTVGTVSHDDDESLSFQITMETNSEDETSTNVENIEYSGDGTMLGEHVKVLTGRNYSFPGLPRMVIGLHPTRITEIEAFKLGERMIEALKQLAGMYATIPVRRADLQVPVESIQFDIANDLQTTVALKLDDSEFQGVKFETPASYEFSMLKRKGELDSGPRTATSIRNEVTKHYDIR